MANTKNIENEQSEADTWEHKLTRKKTKQQLQRNITAFITTLLIVAIFIQFRPHYSPHQNARISDRQIHSGKIYANQTRRFQNSEKELFKPHHRSDKILVDAMWTREPDISNSKLTNVLNKKTSNLIEYKGGVDSNTAIVVDGIDKSAPAHTDTATADITTPASTNKPTTPITTSSDTTPMYTQSPTTPITTASITTPIVTAPGGDPYITTEADPSIEDPNETMKLVRIRRQNAGVTPTSPDPRSTSVSPPRNCPNSANSYTGPYGACQCAPRVHGTYCETQLPPNAQNSGLTVTFATQAVGNYTDMDRDDYQRELEAQYSDLDGFVRIFVLPLEYDSVTNTTNVSFITFFDRATRPQNIDGSAGITSRVVNHNLPININGRNVVFGENKTLLVSETVDGELNLVPIGAVNTRAVCYIYDEIDACGSLNGRGQCVNNTGIPACTCQLQFLGEFCTETIEFPEDDEQEALLAVLLPVLGGLACAVLLCSCCFFLCLRRVNKGEPEEAETESTVSEFPRQNLILPRYRPISQWREFVPGPEPEEVYETYSNRSFYEPQVEVQPIIIERPVIVERVKERRPVIVERVEERRPVIVERVQERRPMYEYADSHSSRRSSEWDQLQRVV